MQYWPLFHFPFSFIIFFSSFFCTNWANSHWAEQANIPAFVCVRRPQRAQAEWIRFCPFLVSGSKRMNVNMAHGNRFLPWPVDSLSFSASSYIALVQYMSPCTFGDVVLYTCDFGEHTYVRWKPYCRMNRRIQECNSTTNVRNWARCGWRKQISNKNCILSIEFNSLFGRLEIRCTLPFRSFVCSDVCIHRMDSLSHSRTHTRTECRGTERIERFKRAQCLQNANTRFAFGSCKRCIHLYESHMINAPFHVARCLLREFSVFLDLWQRCTRPNDNDDDDNYDVLPRRNLSWLLVQAVNIFSNK